MKEASSHQEWELYSLLQQSLGRGPCFFPSQISGSNRELGDLAVLVGDSLILFYLTRSNKSISSQMWHNDKQAGRGIHLWRTGQHPLIKSIQQDHHHLDPALYKIFVVSSIESDTPIIRDEARACKLDIAGLYHVSSSLMTILASLDLSAWDIIYFCERFSRNPVSNANASARVLRYASVFGTKSLCYSPLYLALPNKAQDAIKSIYEHRSSADYSVCDRSIEDGVFGDHPKQRVPLFDFLQASPLCDIAMVAFWFAGTLLDVSKGHPVSGSTSMFGICYNVMCSMGPTAANVDESAWFRDQFVSFRDFISRYRRNAVCFLLDTRPCKIILDVSQNFSVPSLASAVQMSHIGSPFHEHPTVERDFYRLQTYPSHYSISRRRLRESLSNPAKSPPIR